MTQSPHEAIRNLLGSYCEAMDAADWAAIGTLFAHGELVAENGAVVAAGAEAVAAFYERGTRLYDGLPRTRHVTSNTVIELDGDTAAARSAFVVFQQPPGQPLQPIVTGRYRDRFACHDSGWYFAQRMFLVDHVGDLSHHLTFEVDHT